MEAEQEEEEKEMKMVLHCPPIYPLPEEIKKVGSDSEIISLKTPGRYLSDFFFEVVSEHHDSLLRGTYMKSFSAHTCIQIGTRLYMLPFKAAC